MNPHDILPRARTLLSEGRRAEAYTLLRALLNHQRDNAEAWRLMVRAARTEQEAILCLEQVLRLHPGDEWAIHALLRLRDQHPEHAPRPQAPHRPPESPSPPPLDEGPTIEVVSFLDNEPPEASPPPNEAAEPPEQPQPRQRRLSPLLLGAMLLGLLGVAAFFGTRPTTESALSVPSIADDHTTTKNALITPGAEIIDRTQAPSDAHNYLIDLRAGQALDIQVEGLDGVTPAAALYPPGGGSPLSTDDGSGRTAALTHTTAEDGRYIIRVYLPEPGRYRLTLP